MKIFLRSAIKIEKREVKVPTVGLLIEEASRIVQGLTVLSSASSYVIGKREGKGRRVDH